MAAQEESEETEKRQVLDTPGLKKLIAKVKRGDADNAADIARVEAGSLKIAPPEHEGVGTMLFYTGTLIEGGD